MRDATRWSPLQVYEDLEGRGGDFGFPSRLVSFQPPSKSANRRGATRRFAYIYPRRSGRISTWYTGDAPDLWFGRDQAGRRHATKPKASHSLRSSRFKIGLCSLCKAGSGLVLKDPRVRARCEHAWCDGSLTRLERNSMSSMVVTCEHCGARYRLDQERIQGRGARITCPRCRHVFVVYQSSEGEVATEAVKEERPTDVHALDFKSIGIANWKVKTDKGLYLPFWSGGPLFAATTQSLSCSGTRARGGGG